MKTVFVIGTCMIMLQVAFSHSIPGDSLYLGNSVPGIEPKILPLEVTPGTFAAERIAITKDGSEIYYSEIGGYYPVKGVKMRWYKYENNTWSKSSVLFDGFFGPALSLSEDTLYLERDNEAFYSMRTPDGWTTPRHFFCMVDSVHYLQRTSRGTYFASARSKTSVGLSDWSTIRINGTDTAAVSLGYPVNTINDNQDFVVAKDERYMITCLGGPIGVSYPLANGTWTNSRFFDSTINFGLGGWGACLSPDGKYLFYSTGTKPDYSDVHVYWVALGNRIDSLKNTNLPPYVRNKPAPLTVPAGKQLRYVIPADAVCDDDGSVITYEALLLDGSPLPGWLAFDSATRTLTGRPPNAGTTVLRINAYDEKKSMAAFRFPLVVSEK